MGNTPSKISWLRITLIVVGLLASIPLALLFGIFGFLAALLLVVLAAMAK